MKTSRVKRYVVEMTEEEHRLVKTRAARAGMTMRDYMVYALVVLGEIEKQEEKKDT